MSKSEDTTPPTSTCSISKLVKVASTPKTQLTSSDSHQTTADIVLLPNTSLQQTTSAMVASTLLSPTKMCQTGLPSIPVTPSPLPTADTLILLTFSHTYSARGVVAGQARAWSSAPGPLRLWFVAYTAGRRNVTARAWLLLTSTGM